MKTPIREMIVLISLIYALGVMLVMVTCQSKKKKDAFFIRQALKPQGKIGSENFGKAFFSLLKYAIVFLAAIMAVYFITNALHLNDVMIAVILTCLAFVLIAFIFIKKGNS